MASARNKRAVLVGLTGGMGSGKSTVLAMFAQKGAFTLDADAIVRDLLRDKKILKQIRVAFGSGVFDSSGHLDRKALATVVFASVRKRKRLERLLHPRVRETIWRSIEKKNRGVWVIDIPLLYESKWQRKLDAVIVVDATLASRLRRLKRRGFSPSDSKKRIAAQMSLARKVRLADFVVNNNGSIQQTRKQVDEIWKQIPNMTHGGH